MDECINRGKGAARRLWIKTNGPIPDGLWVLHHCDNELCANLTHVYLGTEADNKRDMVNRRRQHRGPQPWKRKLTDADVQVIRQMASAGTPREQIAQLFGISAVYVRDIWLGKARP